MVEEQASNAEAGPEPMIRMNSEVGRRYEREKQAVEGIGKQKQTEKMKEAKNRKHVAMEAGQQKKTLKLLNVEKEANMPKHTESVTESVTERGLNSRIRLRR